MPPSRQCRLCHERKGLSEFRIGPSGRTKSICRECTDTLIIACLGELPRRCATCRKPTANYRCAGCWAKIRGSGNNGSGFDPNYLPGQPG